MPQQHGNKPLPPEAMAAIEKNLNKDSVPADPTIFPAKPGTQEFALAAKLRFEEHMAAFKKEMGEEIFAKQCAVTFLTVYDGGLGSIDAADGNTVTLPMLMAVTVHRLAESIQKAQQFLPKRDSYHKTIVGICNRLMQLSLAMTPDGDVDKPSQSAPPSGIITH